MSIAICLAGLLAKYEVCCHNAVMILSEGLPKILSREMGVLLGILPRGMEQWDGFLLMVAIYSLAGTALAVRKTLGVQKSAPDAGAPWHFGSVVASMMAYGFYVAAALMANAEFPQFLRDHLFDGLAPAALVGVLVDRSLRDDPREAFPRVRRPVWILFDLFISGIAIFSSTAAAAVFSSGSNDFIRPIVYCSFFGGLTLPVAYFTTIFRSDNKVPSSWWWTKRPTDADSQVSADERQAVLAFCGIYQVKSVVTATTGSYAESVGAVHFYTWQAVPDCSGQSCVVKVTSSTGSRTIVTYSNGEFLGTGRGSALCVDPRTGTPIGSFVLTTLHVRLRPAVPSSPITSLVGVMQLNAWGTCSSSGTGTFSYTLTRTGSVSPSTSLR
jgi:hypothetical protein